MRPGRERSIATSRPAENAVHNAVGNGKQESSRAMLFKGCNRYGTDMARDLHTWQRTMPYGSLQGAPLPWQWEGINPLPFVCCGAILWPCRGIGGQVVRVLPGLMGYGTEPPRSSARYNRYAKGM